MIFNNHKLMMNNCAVKTP